MLDEEINSIGIQHEQSIREEFDQLCVEWEELPSYQKTRIIGYGHVLTVIQYGTFWFLLFLTMNTDKTINCINDLWTTNDDRYFSKGRYTHRALISTQDDLSKAAWITHKFAEKYSSR